MTHHNSDPLAAIAGFFSGLSPAKLDSLGDVYSPSVEFQDPLHHTHGIAALRGIYEHTLRQLGGVTVIVLDSHGDDRSGFLLWTMRYQLNGKERDITGTSHLKYAADGRIAVQRDYWDASFPVYGQFPLLGPIMRTIKRFVAAKNPGGNQAPSSGCHTARHGNRLLDFGGLPARFFSPPSTHEHSHHFNS